MNYSIYATRVCSEFKNQPVAEWEWFEGTFAERDRALARCRALIKPTRWEPRVFQVRDDEGNPVSKFYTNRPELIEQLGLESKTT